MIGHEAVRNDSELLLSGASENLRSHEIDWRSRCEDVTAVMCAETQGIAIKPEIGKRLQMLGMPRIHAVRSAKFNPVEAIRLRPDPTYCSCGRHIIEE
jgi:hypothetical protein